ncbi:MAG: DUF4350 domain-containing protein [Acidobacteria bacterium]|nr:DUF4350 domain-containing protein [Acidobacteriota bacterium]MBS1865449.1 DUF4350 domain-containing protein [Acidobacteriota bacterium]
MHLGLERSERKLVLGAGVLLVILVVVSVLVSPPENANGTGGASSYSAEWSGTKAGYLFLQGMGYRVERWESQPQELPDKAAEEGAVLILAEPSQKPTEGDKRTIRMFLQRGGTVLATGAKVAEFLPDAQKFEEGEKFAAYETFHPVEVSPLVRDAQEIRMNPPEKWRPSGKSEMIVYGNQTTAAVVTISVGKGQVIWWADSYPMTNGGLRDANNAQFFLNSVGEPDGRQIYWDEYFHGVESSFWSYLAKTPAPWGLVQIGIVFLAVVLTFSRRTGPVRAPQNTSKLPPLEFVETLGDLYQEAHAGTTAVRIMYERMRFQLLRTLGLPGTASSKELAQSASEALRWNRSEIAAVLEKSEQAKRGHAMEEKECLTLVKQLYWYSQKLEPGKMPAEERSRG